MGFVWEKHDLNPEQVEAITHPGSVFLVACPGSGKTRALTYKVALELSRLESEKQRVVAITYTNRAAEEIEERIERLGVDTEQLWIGTIHSFCLEWILRPYGIYHEKLRHGFRVIDQHERDLRLEALGRLSSPRVRPHECSTCSRRAVVSWMRRTKLDDRPSWMCSTPIGQAWMPSG